MELVNFIIEDTATAIEVEGKHRDLHNNYEFRSVYHDIINQEIILQFLKSEGNWVPKKDPKSLKLICCGVSLFKAKDREPEWSMSEYKY